MVSVTAVVPTGYGPGGLWVNVIGLPLRSKEPLSTEAAAKQSAPPDTVTSLHLATGERSSAGRVSMIRCCGLWELLENMKLPDGSNVRTLPPSEKNCGPAASALIAATFSTI